MKGNFWVLGGLASALAIVALVVSIIALFTGAGADTGLARSAAAKSSPDEYAVHLVGQAVTRYQQEGKEALLTHYNSPESVDGEWYVFIADENNALLAHANPALLGKTLDDLGIDITGYRFGELMVAATEEGQWVDYLWLNPATGNQEYKHSWVVRQDGLLFGSGWYQIAPFGFRDKQNPAGYTVALVNQTLQRYNLEGREATLAYLNSPESVDGEWYVFVVDENNLVTAHPNQDLLGQELTGSLGIDIAGYNFGEVMAAATEEGHWVDYLWLNPVSKNQEFKHSWVVRHGGLIFGSGWYQVASFDLSDRYELDPPVYTIEYVDDALRHYKAYGREKALEYFNSPESVHGEWYVFVVGEDGLVKAHVDPARLGQDLRGDLGTDINGYEFGKDMLAATEAGTWVSYTFLNPATGNEEVKHSWVVRHDGLIIGSGWYE